MFGEDPVWGVEEPDVWENDDVVERFDENGWNVIPKARASDPTPWLTVASLHCLQSQGSWQFG